MDKNEALKLLSDTDSLAARLPEVLALADCLQLGPHHAEGDVLQHTKAVVEHLPDGAGSELVWAAILHDIAKPLTRQEQTKNGEIVTRFFLHEVVGATLAKEISERMGLSALSQEKIVWLVANHMRVLALPAMGDKKAIEFVNHEYFSDLQKLFQADLAASQARDEEWEKKKALLARTINAKILEIKNRP